VGGSASCLWKQEGGGECGKFHYYHAMSFSSRYTMLTVQLHA